MCVFFFFLEKGAYALFRKKKAQIKLHDICLFICIYMCMYIYIYSWYS